MFVLKGCYIFFSVLLEKSYQSKIFFTVLSSLMRLFQVSQCNNQTSQKCLCSFVWGGLKKCPGFSFFFVKVAQVSWASLNFWHASLMRQPVIVGCSGKNVNRISNSLWEEINAKEDFLFDQRRPVFWDWLILFYKKIPTYMSVYIVFQVQNLIY